MVVVQRLKKYREIPIKLIEPSLTPSREIFEDIDVLAETIRRHGLLEPILVRQLDGQHSFQVVVGERRLRACKKAGLDKVPCIILDGVTEDQILTMQLVENIHRADLKPFEEIRLVETLKNRYNLSNDEIAVKIGLSASTVSNYLAIAKDLPKEYIKMIEKGKGRTHSPKALTITKGLLLAGAGLPADKLKETVELITKKGLTRCALAKKLAKDEKSKIKRVVAGKVYWKQLTRSLRDFANYWSDYCKLNEWEDVKSYHLRLEVTMPKDLNETHEPENYEPNGLETLSADEAPQVCGSCGKDILEGEPFAEKDGLYYCRECADGGIH